MFRYWNKKGEHVLVLENEHELKRVVADFVNLVRTNTLLTEPLPIDKVFTRKRGTHLRKNVFEREI